ncbi:peroxisomal succinyl-coenzyme A thioesterase-like isoform X3 [Ornithorhynchus anatinus]|nr:peroxisomal succinyl-coenzyme A thioesterase-like isoform X3 [Ornithorhynchus anatinus]
MLRQPQVKGPGVGLLGISKGSDLCLSMAAFLKGITATVSINGSAINNHSVLRYKDVRIPPIGYNLRRIRITGLGVLDIVDICNDLLDGPRNPSVLPLERAEGVFLFIVGQDDHNWKSEFYADIASKRLELYGKEKPQILCYPGTGHYIEPPYFPMCPASTHALVRKPVIWGGEPRAHSKAQVDAWRQIQAFFRKHLGMDENAPPPRL